MSQALADAAPTATVRRPKRSLPELAWLRRLLAGDPARPLSTTAVSTVWAMLALSALAGWLLLYAVVLSGLQQHRDNSVLYSQLREGLSGATTPIGGVIAPGTPIALIEAPGTGLSRQVVVEGTVPTDLRNGPGHRRDTPLPGQPGVSILFGRSISYGGPFSALAQLRPGQRIDITTGQGQFSYTVDRLRHAGDPLPTALADGGSRLLLETTTGFGLSPTSTLLVDASLQGKAVPAPSGRLSAVPPAERAMAGDPSGLLTLVLWLQLLLIVVVVVIWARSRWGAAQSWLIGLPLLLAVLWGATGNAMMLLPNLL